MGRLGRRRGYDFENTIARRYNACGWRVWRLGALAGRPPDILAVGPDSIHVHELKTTTGNSVRIPAYQIANCADLASAFGRYEGRAVLSARFGRTAEYHYVWDGADPEPVTINIHGKIRGCGAEPMTWDELLESGGQR